MSLNEAYEYLINVKVHGSSTGKATSQSYQWSEQEWREQQREYAKERAREHARMRYEEFIKSDYYKEQVVVDIVTLHIGILVSVVLLVVFPLIMLINYGLEGFIPIIIVNFVLIPFHLRSYRNLKKVSLRTFKSAIVDLVKLQWFQLTVLTIVNVFTIVRIGLHTLISPWILILAYAVFIAVFYAGTKHLKSKYVLAYGIAPIIISALLLLNYYFSDNERTESYLLQTGYPQLQDDTLIELEGDIYQEYIGLRIFSDFSEVQDAKEIQYTMKDGLLGLKVMTKYRFIKDSPSIRNGSDVFY